MVLLCYFCNFYFFFFFTLHYFLKYFYKYLIIFFHFGLFLPFLFPFQWLLMFCLRNWEAFRVFPIWMIWDLMTFLHFHNPKWWFCWAVEINVRSYNLFLFSFFSILWYWKFEIFFQNISKISQIYNQKKIPHFFFLKSNNICPQNKFLLAAWC